MSNYSQSEKLLEVKDKYRIIGEFLDDHFSKNNYVISIWIVNEDEDTKEYMPEVLVPVFISKEKILAEYFGINLIEIENERRRMIKELQK